MPYVGQKGVLKGYSPQSHPPINGTPFKIIEVYTNSFRIKIDPPSYYQGTYTIQLDNCTLDSTGQMDLFDAQ